MSSREKNLKQENKKVIKSRINGKEAQNKKVEILPDGSIIAINVNGLNFR